MNTNIDAYNENGRTPLMEAVLIGDVSLVKKLLDNGANPYLKDESFGTSTALDIASREAKENTKTNYDEIIKLLRDAMSQDLPEQFSQGSENGSIITSDISEYLSIISKNTANNGKVSVTNIDIPFKSLVIFLTKLGFAAIPATVIIVFVISIILKIIE